MLNGKQFLSIRGVSGLWRCRKSSSSHVGKALNPPVTGEEILLSLEALAPARQIDHQNAEPGTAQGRNEFRITKKANPLLLNRAGERRLDYE